MKRHFMLCRKAYKKGIRTFAIEGKEFFFKASIEPKKSERDPDNQIVRTRLSPSWKRTEKIYKINLRNGQQINSGAIFTTKK